MASPQYLLYQVPCEAIATMRLLVTSIRSSSCSQCQVQHLQDYIDSFNADKRDDDATDAIDQ